MDLFANSRREASSSRYARVFYLAVGIVSFVAGIGLLGLNALNGAWWPWVANAESAKWEQLVDNGVPIEVVELAKDCKAWANCAVFPIAIGEEWSGEVVVAEFGTYNDLWRGSEATFAVTYDSSWQPRSVKTHGGRWGGTIMSPEWGSTRGWIEATLPAPPVSLLHQRVEAIVRLKVTAPKNVGGFFEDVTTDYDRAFDLFVVTAEEKEMMTPSYFAVDGTGPALFSGVGGAALAGFGVLYLVSLLRDIKRDRQARADKSNPHG